MRKKGFLRIALIMCLTLIVTLIMSINQESKVYAEDESKIEVKYYDGLIANKKNILIVLNDAQMQNITKQQLMAKDSDITDVKNAAGNSLANTEKVKTNDKVIKNNNDEYEAILVGDSNSDGIICDTDDIMNIIDDYLGKKKLAGENKIAANLENTDEVLDTDDLMKMINKYLGKLNNLLKLPITSNNEENEALYTLSLKISEKKWSSRDLVFSYSLANVRATVEMNGNVIRENLSDSKGKITFGIPELIERRKSISC